VVVRAETEVATARTDIEEPVVFGTADELRIVPCELRRLATQAAGREPSDETTRLENGQLPCFSQVPRPGDALLIGLSNPVPSCAVVLRFECPVRGHGIDPRNPPLAWEAWNGAGWSPGEVERDDCGGFNRSGDALLHVPASHRVSAIAGQRAGWLRCQVVPAAPGQPDLAMSSENDRPGAGRGTRPGAQHAGLPRRLRLRVWKSLAGLLARAGQPGWRVAGRC
jgi:hypothetical protein